MIPLVAVCLLLRMRLGLGFKSVGYANGRRARMKKPFVTFLMLIILSPLIMGNVYAWDPTTSDLTGTNSSTNNSVSGTNRRFDIDGSSSPTVYGMQTGDDSDSIAHLMKTGAIQASSVFSTVTTSTSATGTQEPF